MTYKKKKAEACAKYYGGKHYKPIHYTWFDSLAYRDLSCTARALLYEIMRRDTMNNGKIVFSNSQARKAINASENTVKKAFLELINHGFIEMVTEGNWHRGLAREWRITFWGSSGGGVPTHEWKNWEPEK